MSSIQKTETNYGGICEVKKRQNPKSKPRAFSTRIFVAAFSSGDGFFLLAPTPPKPTSLMIAVLELLHH
jgi:hypothetical protein